MSTPRTQRGYIFEANGAWHLRFNVHENGKRKQRSAKLCGKDDLHPSKDASSVVALADAFILKINQANAVNDAQPGHNCPVCGNRCTRTIKGTFASKETNTHGR